MYKYTNVQNFNIHSVKHHVQSTFLHNYIITNQAPPLQLL